MYAGAWSKGGGVEELFATPNHPYTRQLIRCIPRLDGKPRCDADHSWTSAARGVAAPGCPFAPRCEVAA